MFLMCAGSPWGNSNEWNGAWSDDSAEWEENPGAASAVGFSKAPDGLFWMEFDDERAWASDPRPLSLLSTMDMHIMHMYM